VYTWLGCCCGRGRAAAALLSVGPFVGYRASRTVGVPGDPGDVGNWADWVGTLALIVEAALVTVGLGMVLGMSPAGRALSVSGAAPSTDAAELLIADAAHNADAHRRASRN
jgi:hypothetical protein